MYINTFDVKAILHLNEMFFEIKSEGGNKSGIIYGLRTNYQERWDLFVNTNNISINLALINCFYIGEENSWNGITESDFKTACDYVN